MTRLGLVQNQEVGVASTLSYFQIYFQRFVPKSVIALRTYSLKTFFADLIAGLTVGLVALPLAMAFAISSGVPPESGLYCAIIAGFIISALGGSQFQIGGPTGAFVIVVAGIVHQYGIDGLFMCTLMAGVFLVLLGVTGLGAAVKFIPRPVVIGFTNGIAVLIASTQIKDFLGLEIESPSSEFLGRMGEIGGALGTVDVTTAVLAVGALVGILLVNRFVKKVPGTIIALLVGTILAVALGLPVASVGSKFGEIPSGLPGLQVPSFRSDLILPLLPSALTITMLGAIESLLSAVVADRMSGDRHNPNVELVAQGFANIASPLFGGLPATGAIARTATNIRSGAKTPVAGMIHALTLLAIVLVAAPSAKEIPLCILAAILFVVAYNMGEWRELPGIWRSGKGSIAVWLITFGLTVVADLTVAVEVGMILAVLVYIGQVNATTTVERVTPEYVQQGRDHSLQINPHPEGVVIFRIHGPFLFGSTDKLDVVTEEFESLPQVVIIRLRNMNALDVTGLKAIEDVAKRIVDSGRSLILCGARSQPTKMIAESSLPGLLGAENICENVEQAVARSVEILAEPPNGV